MNKKIIGIFICTLLIITILQTLNTMSKNITLNDPDFNKQWYLDNIGQTDGKPDADIDAPEVWEIETGNSEIVIAIIDSGIDYTHPDLDSNLWINEDEIPDNDIDDDNNGYIDDYHGYDFKNNDSDTLDEHGHGTVIAGVIGATTNNGIGIAGVCWNCQIMPLKFWNTDARNELYFDRIDNIIDAIKYAADNGANVISMSFGADEKFFTSEEFIQFKDAIDYAYNKGCILVAAALNDNTSDPIYPGAWNNVICVAGTDDNDNRMEYQYPDGEIVISNYGEWVDIAAPGEMIYTTSPTYDCVITSLGRDHNFTFMSGTSLATPIVAGLAALLLSRNKLLTPDEVIKIIKTNIDPYDSEYYLGTGRINAFKALLALIADNVAPEKPTILGNSSGKPDTEYTYTFVSNDLEEDKISYLIDWGDNTPTGWTTKLYSGEVYKSSHAWSKEGNFTIIAKAKDIYNAESELATLTVSITKSKVKNIPLFIQRFYHRFPFFEKILNLYY